MRNFRELKVYQKSLDLTEEVYRFKDGLPKTEEFGLKDQFRRSVTSISINISEGVAKATNKHFKTYLEH
ncbi:four helix bundle protein [Bacteroidia bacterium]|nr:four helix bundle protein [Bacteroidia bacterium]MDB9882203.1 four helix bundle protein [Bacteroidia bacterium]